MLVSKAYAQSVEVAGEAAFQGTQATTTTAPAITTAPAMNAPSTAEAFAWNMGLVLVLVVLFYLLLIAPQQKRFKQHSTMLAGLKKGDKVVTGGGLVGTIDKLVSDDEVLIDLGGGFKVTALRSTINGKDDPLLRKNAANDPKADKDKKAVKDKKDDKKK